MLFHDKNRHWKTVCIYNITCYFMIKTGIGKLFVFITLHAISCWLRNCAKSYVIDCILPYLVFYIANFSTLLVSTETYVHTHINNCLASFKQISSINKVD